MHCCRGNICFPSQTAKLHRVAEMLIVSASYKYFCVYTGLNLVQIHTLLVLVSVPSLSTLVFPTLSFLKDFWKPKVDLNKREKLLLIFEKLSQKNLKMESRLNNQILFLFRLLVSSWKSWIFCSKLPPAQKREAVAEFNHGSEITNTGWMRRWTIGFKRQHSSQYG